MKSLRVCINGISAPLLPRSNFVLERPLTQSDLSVGIEAYLRENTSPQEAKDFLNADLGIINDYEGIEEVIGVNAERKCRSRKCEG